MRAVAHPGGTYSALVWRGADGDALAPKDVRGVNPEGLCDPGQGQQRCVGVAVLDTLPNLERQFYAGCRGLLGQPFLQPERPHVPSERCLQGEKARERVERDASNPSTPGLPLLLLFLCGPTHVRRGSGPGASLVCNASVVWCRFIGVAADLEDVWQYAS